VTEVRYEVVDGVAVISLDAPKRRNALTPRMAAELAGAVDEADSDDGVGAIVLRGGPSFCAGADLQTLEKVKTDPAEDVSFRTIDTIYNTFLRLGASRSPSIAAVRGAAVGAGVNLAMAADLRIIARDARLLSGFARIGVHPGGGHFALLAGASGREAAAAIGLFGCEIDGTRAAEIGLAWEAVDDGDVEPIALDLARRAARDPELARRMTTTFRQQAAAPGLPWEAAVQVERASQMWSFRRRGPSISDAPTDS
jgi:enoyl-CoA hydratase